MNEDVKDLMRRLGEAASESLSDSESVADVLRQVKRAGFKVTLRLDAAFALDTRNLEAERLKAASNDTTAKLAPVESTARDQIFWKTAEGLSGTDSGGDDRSPSH